MKCSNLKFKLELSLSIDDISYKLDRSECVSDASSSDGWKVHAVGPLKYVESLVR